MKAEKQWEHERHEALISEGVEYLKDEWQNAISPGFRDALLRYLEQRVETGGFLRACLENDFSQAVLRAHLTVSARDLKQIACALSAFPANAWGSKETVQTWIDAGKGSAEI